MDQISAMRAFVRVAETGSFSAAARSTDTTQATISKRVAALEEMLGVKLLIRSSREQSLTEAGQEYFQRCIDILEAIDEAETIARCHTEAPRGLLRITAAVDFGRLILPPLLREFMGRYPDIRIDLVLSNYQLDLIAGGIDIAIRLGAFEDSSLISRPLCDSPLCLVAAPEYLKKYDQPQHPLELSEHECLLYAPADNPHRWPFKDDGKVINVSIDGKFQCDNGEVMLDMILAGCGIGLLPYWVVHDALSQGYLQQLLPEYMVPATAIRMVYPDRKHLPLKARYFLDFMLEKAQGHPALR